MARSRRQVRGPRPKASYALREGVADRPDRGSRHGAKSRGVRGPGYPERVGPCRLEAAGRAVAQLRDYAYT
jgi:hypothetical protein